MEFKYEGHSLKGGTYKITNNLNGRIYIGSAKEFKARWKQHAKSLETGKHSNTFLLNDFKKCGSEMFVFEVLEVIDGSKEDRLSAEQRLLDIHYDKMANCYNLCDRAISREGSKSKNPEETGSKLRGRTPWNKGKIGVYTEEAKQKMSEAKLGMESPMKGRTHTQEAIEKNRQAHLGKKFPERSGENSPVFGKPGPNRGKSMSPEQRQKISESLKARNAYLRDRL